MLSTLAVGSGCNPTAGSRALLQQSRRRRSGPRPQAARRLGSQMPGLRACCPLLSRLRNAKSEQMVCVFHRAQKTGDLGAHRSLWFLKWGGRLPAAARHVGEEMRSLWPHLTPSSLAVWLGRAWPAALSQPRAQGIQPLPGKPRVDSPHPSARKVKARQNSISGKASVGEMGRDSFYFVRETVILMLCKCTCDS